MAGGVYKKAESNNRICKSDKNVLPFLLGTLTNFWRWNIIKVPNEKEE